LNYYNEVFNLVIDYANKYYKNGLPPIPKQFLDDKKETKNINDSFKSWFNENCYEEVGANIPLKLLVSESSMNEKLVKDGMKRLGYIYKSDLSKMGKDLYGKYYKGGYENIKINIQYDNDNEEEGYAESK
jgi:hypothetical protein